METVIVEIKRSEARKLLVDLADLGLIAIKNQEEEKKEKEKLSDLRHQNKTKMTNEEINSKLQQLRNEWQRDI